VVALREDVRDQAAVIGALEGADALLHLAPHALGEHDESASAGRSSPAGDWQSERDALDVATRGTYVLLNAAVEAGVRRVVLGSTLALFERYPLDWSVTEAWRPLPDVAAVPHLAAYLAEESAKELSRVEPLQVICLRFGTVVDDSMSHQGPYDPRWVHVDDAVQACRLALEATLDRRRQHSSGRIEHGWWVFHIPGGGSRTRFPLARARGEQGLGYAPTHDFVDAPGAVGASAAAPASGAAAAPGTTPALQAAGASHAPSSRIGHASDLAAGQAISAVRAVLEPRERVPSRPIRNVVFFGAGGPLAAAAAPLLAPSFRLRLTDIRPLAEIAAEAKPQSPGAPLPAVLEPPHETMRVDVADLDQVLRACEGMDAIVNCTVVRPDPVLAFHVNTIGAYHVMRAAVAHRIRRVVHTGPLQVLNDLPGGYAWDFGIPDTAPARPGNWIYLHSKYLGQEAVRLFAEAYDLEVPTLYFCNFVNPRTATPGPEGINPMTVSWDDAGHAIRRAVETPSLPSPFEVIHILADLPHGKYPSEKAKRILGWQPRDDLAHLYARRD
jgi:nucleoside-diphosphate-sugar epimerase